jgi:hypothetical protein
MQWNAVGVNLIAHGGADRVYRVTPVRHTGMICVSQHGRGGKMITSQEAASRKGAKAIAEQWERANKLNGR